MEPEAGHRPTPWSDQQKWKQSKNNTGLDKSVEILLVTTSLFILLFYFMLTIIHDGPPFVVTDGAAFSGRYVWELLFLI